MYWHLKSFGCVIVLISLVIPMFSWNILFPSILKCDLHRSSGSTLDFLTVVSDRIARTFNRSGANPAVALDISKAFDKIWHAGLPLKVKSYGISGHIFGLISFFLSNRQLQVIQDGKLSQQYPVDAGVLQEFILGPALFLPYINDLPDDVICNIAIDADSTTLYCKCNQASHLWQQL